MLLRALCFLFDPFPVDSQAALFVSSCTRETTFRAHGAVSKVRGLTLVPRSSRLTVHKSVEGCIFDVISS